MTALQAIVLFGSLVFALAACWFSRSIADRRRRFGWKDFE